MPDGSWTTEQVTVTWVEVSQDGEVVTQTWENGMMVIAKGDIITESHLVHIVAFDAAGNKTESEKVRFYVIHKPEEKDEDKKDESGAIWLPEPQQVAERRGRPGNGGSECLTRKSGRSCARHCQSAGHVLYNSITTGRIMGRRLVCS